MKEKVIKRISVCKSKATIYFIDGEKLEVNPLIIEDLKLYKGKTLDARDIKIIKEHNKEESLFDFAIKKFKTQNFTSGKIRDLLLKKSIDKNVCDKVIIRLIKCGILSDEKFVSECLEKADYKHFGYKKIIQKLYELKVDEKFIKEIKYNENREIKQAKELINVNINKYTEKSNIERKRKFYNLLLRNGFEANIAEELVNKIPNSNKKHELNVLKLEYFKIYKLYSCKFKGIELKTKIRTYLLKKGYSINDIEQLED